MTVNTEFTDKTSAADKSVGFDFQYYYFLYRLLNLKSNEAVGLEVLDDVHSELASDRQILVQLKHTTQTKANGSTKNLTALDIDLWKSFSNWSQTITDKNAGRASKNAQLEFIKKTDFLLVSNKSESERNTVLNEIKRFQNNEIQYGGLQVNLGKLQDKSTNDSVKTYIQNVLDLDAEVGEAFFRNVKPFAKVKRHCSNQLGRMAQCTFSSAISNGKRFEITYHPLT